MIELPTESDPVRVIQGDCLEVLRQLPDGCVDAVVTDPPYGLTWSGTGFAKQPLLDHKEAAGWDDRPSDDEIRAIAQVSDKCIVWGGNYFADALGSFRSPLVWDKMTGANPFADGELAWTSFKTGTLRIFRHQWCGAFKDSERGNRNKHPTQKPVALMEWCIRQCKLEPGSMILDPYAGSGTTGVAAVKMGMRAILIEREPAYCDIARRRVAEAMGTGLLAGIA